MTRYYAIARNPKLGTTHRLAQTANGSLRFITAPDATLRTFARDDLDRVRSFCHARDLHLIKWAAVDPYPWLEVDHDTKLPHPKLARILNEAGKRCGRKLRINEGTRTRARQQQLWDAKVAELMRRGMSRAQAEQEARRWVARPGTSNHEDQNADGYGVAADVQDARDGENLRPMLERRGLLGWFRDAGAHFPMPHERWHCELIGVPR